jgi:Acylamino-acid-releasing enzyme, N-terminal domain
LRALKCCTSWLQIFLSHKDAVNDKDVTTCHTVTASTAPGARPARLSPGTPVAENATVCISPSGNSKVVIRSGEQVVLEVWRGVCKVQEIEVADKLHGPVVSDGYCSTGPVWSWDERHLAYVAQARPCELPWSGNLRGQQAPVTLVQAALP